MTFSSSITMEWRGLISFEEAHKEQLRRCSEAQRNNAAGIILGLEHEAVITLGRQASAALEVVASSSSLPVIHTDRGGQATIHSPGQLVIYPILPVLKYGGLRNYLSLLMQVTKGALKTYGVDSHEVCGQPGLYTAKGKIAFAGLRVDRGVSRHGLSINLNNDLALFASIRACGIAEAPLDRLASYGIEVTPKEFFEEWTKQFSALTQSSFS